MEVFSDGHVPQVIDLIDNPDNRNQFSYTMRKARYGSPWRVLFVSRNRICIHILIFRNHLQLQGKYLL
jgi:hypothetical protein